jgi:hypothetical protein
VTGSGQIEMKCSACGGEDLERVMSASNHFAGTRGSSGSAGPCATTRSCGPGRSCTSVELPGHKK